MQNILLKNHIFNEIFEIKKKELDYLKMLESNILKHSELLLKDQLNLNKLLLSNLFNNFT